MTSQGDVGFVAVGRPHDSGHGNMFPIIKDFLNFFFSWLYKSGIILLANAIRLGGVYSGLSFFVYCINPVFYC